MRLSHNDAYLLSCKLFAFERIHQYILNAFRFTFSSLVKFRIHKHSPLERCLTPMPNLPAAIDSYTPWSRKILKLKEQETRRRQIPPPQVPISMVLSCLHN